MRNNFNTQELDINSISSYLNDKNWICNNYSENMNIWHRSEEKYEDYEIIQPLNTDILGYKQRVFELIKTLSDFEKRESNFIFEDLKLYSFDIFKIRVIGDDLEKGYIGINDGVLLFEKTKLLINSILHSSISKKGYYTTPVSNRFDEYYNSLKFGQTEHGSYIINVLAPHLIENSNQIDSFDNDLTANITNNFDRSLEALCNALENFDQNNNISIFKHAITQGVNANLCESLVGISGQDNKHAIEISIRSKLKNQNKVYKFEKNSIQKLKEVAEYLKGDFLIENYEVIGVITSLNQKYEEETGIINIKFKYEKTTKNIKIQLTPEEYLDAIKAHANKLTITIFGDLLINGKNTTLLNHNKFSTIQQRKLDY